MTPPAAATAAARSDAQRIRRSPAGAPPRRVSGPRADRRDPRAAAKTRLSAAPALAPAQHTRVRRPAAASSVGTLALPGRKLRAGVRSPRAGDVGVVVDRLLSSRAWIGVVAGLLIGLVFLQVALLKVNAGIGGTVQQANTLERSNDGLRAEISLLRQDARITKAATSQGMIMPQPNQVRYLSDGKTGAVGGAGGVASSVAADGSAIDDGSGDAGAVAADPTATSDGSTDTTSGDTTAADTTDTSGDTSGAPAGDPTAADASGDTRGAATGTDQSAADGSADTGTGGVAPPVG